MLKDKTLKEIEEIIHREDWNAWFFLCYSLYPFLSIALSLPPELLKSIIILMKTLKNGEYEYRESDFLGEGSFAKVYKGVIVKSQRVVAVRLLPLKLIKQYGNKIKTIISIPDSMQMAKSLSSRS